MLFPQLARLFQADWIHGSACCCEDWPLGLSIFLCSIFVWSEGDLLQLALSLCAGSLYVDLVFNFPRAVRFSPYPSSCWHRQQLHHIFPFFPFNNSNWTLFKLLIWYSWNLKAVSFSEYMPHRKWWDSFQMSQQIRFCIDTYYIKRGLQTAHVLILNKMFVEMVEYLCLENGPLSKIWHKVKLPSKWKCLLSQILP